MAAAGSKSGVTPASKSVAARTLVLAALVVAGMAIVALLQRAHGARPEVAVAGNRAFSAGQLRAALEADPLADGELALSAFYWDHGYAQVSVTRTGDRYAIDEGPRFAIGSVRVTDAPPGLVHVRPGDTFSRRAIADDRERVSRYFQDQGYAYVNVLPITRIHEHTIDLTLEVAPGKRSRIEHVVITGAVRTPEAVVRRALAVAPGDAFSQTALDTGKHRVMGLGFHTVDVATRRGSSDELVDVRVDVTE